MIWIGILGIVASTFLAFALLDHIQEMRKMRILEKRIDIEAKRMRDQDQIIEVINIK
jgi:hypothetical protein